MRLLVAVCVALYAMLRAWERVERSGPSWVAGDFTFWWRAARAVASGLSPYAVVVPTGPYPFSEHFLYPLPAALVVLPFALLRAPVALVAFSGMSAALLGYVATRDGFRRLPLFASFSFWVCAEQGQWAPLIVAAALSPVLGWLLSLKPTLGLVGFAYRPTWRAMLLGLTLPLVAFLVQPDWLVQWVRATQHHIPGAYVIPALTPWGGPLLLLALLRWRRPGARLLFVLACVPQSMFFCDQLLLWLIPETLVESVLLTGLSFAAALTVYWTSAGPIAPEAVAAAEALTTPPLLALLYLPCLIMVMRRPNTGELAPWAEAMAGRLPRWLRGSTPPTTTR